MIILIPAYEPDEQLIHLIRSVFAAEPCLTVVVVDDGSGPDYRSVFDDAARLGCSVHSYARNRGKGYALKTGFGFIADTFPGQDVVCADSDGQPRSRWSRSSIPPQPSRRARNTRCTPAARPALRRAWVRERWTARRSRVPSRLERTRRRAAPAAAEKPAR
jgi:glycosyltransferase involved in cell wall biosynthesis